MLSLYTSSIILVTLLFNYYSPIYRHVVFAPSSVNSYGSSLFPGISDSIFAAIASDKEDDWNLVRRQIDIVRNHLRYATMINIEPITAI